MREAWAVRGIAWGLRGPDTPPEAPPSLLPQIDSFELLYYYDEYLGHSMW